MTLAIIGASSEIAQQVARLYSTAGHDLLLIGRNMGRLEAFVQDSLAAGVEVCTCNLDISNLDDCAYAADRVVESLGKDPHVLVAVGSIENEYSARSCVDDAVQLVDVNYRNVVALITPIANALKERRTGCVTIITSVAGDRGRQSNYIYGSAKSGLSIYAQGLRNYLHRFGVHVLTVKPGYVDTKMLRQVLERDKLSRLRMVIGNPERVAQNIYSAAMKRKDVLYVPRIWVIVMFVVKNIPEKIFKRLRL